MWEVLGRGNEAVVQALISAAARLDQRFCAELQNLALLSRARALIRAGGEGMADALAQLVTQEAAVTLARDQEGCSLWHDLAAGEHVALLRRLLPMVQGLETPGQAKQQVAEQQAVQGQAVATEQREPQPVNPLNLADLKGNTPLHVAAQAGNAEVARLLIDQGAALDIQNRCGQPLGQQLRSSCQAGIVRSNVHSKHVLHGCCSMAPISARCRAAAPPGRSPLTIRIAGPSLQGPQQVRSGQLAGQDAQS